MKTLIAFALPFALVAAGCSSSDSGSSSSGSTSSSSTSSGTGGSGGGATSTTSTQVTTGSAGSGGGGPTCQGPGRPSPEKPVQIESVEATVVDLGGAPIADAEVQVCGLDICLYGTTASDGSVLVAVNDELDNPAFKFGDALTYAKFAIQLDAGVSTLGTVATAKLPTNGVAMAAGAEVTSGDVTLSIPEGGVVVIDDLIYDEEDKQGFRAVTIPSDQFSAAVDPALSILIAYGVAPVDTAFCPPAKVTVPNDIGLAPGTQVEFWVQGLNVLEDWAPYGGWIKESDGEVSADGTTISTSDGGGLSMLSTFGIAAK